MEDGKKNTAKKKQQPLHSIDSAALSTTTTNVMGKYVLYASTILVLIISVALCSSAVTFIAPLASNYTIPYVRPPPSSRRFNSTFIDALIINYTSRMKDKNLATLFSNCFPNTLDTTVVRWSSNDSFVITGDIDAMWLRDSANQVQPYIRYVPHDADLKAMVRGLCFRHLRSVLIDPYANAYNYNASSNAGHQKDLRRPRMTKAVFEGKYELDSLCATLKLVSKYTFYSGDASVVASSDFLKAANVILTVFENQTKSSLEQQQDEETPFQFFRDNWPSEYDTYPREHETSATGMIRSAFRPSDDQTMFDFLVPSNFMAVVELQQFVNLTKFLLSNPQQQQQQRTKLSDLRNRAEKLIAGIEEGIRKFAITKVAASTAAAAATASTSIAASTAKEEEEEEATTILRFETDGRGAQNLMDDANLPSLLGILFLGFDPAKGGKEGGKITPASGITPRVLNNTRRWVLSSLNPYYYCGRLGCGVGSPHTWQGYIWPMAVITRALTSDSDTEILESLELLKQSARFTGFMHESFDANNAKKFTRKWFAWANTLFGELICNLGEERPHLIF